MSDDDHNTQSKLEFLRLLCSPTIKDCKCPNQAMKSLFTILTMEYSLYKAKEASKQERTVQNLTSNSFSYGEINFDSLSEAIRIAKPDTGGIFYDLGSGVGKGVIAASLLHQFSFCKGIELLHSLHEMSLELNRSIQSKKHLILEEMEKTGDIDCQLPEIKFINGDLREVNNLFISKIDWSDGTFIFASTTCYDPKLMETMSKKALLLKDNSIFVTLTKRLEPESFWECIDILHVEMSWGQATMYIQRKKMIQKQQQQQQQ